MFIQLTDEEKSRLQLLAGDRAAIEGLKKLFINACLEFPNKESGVLAASSLAVNFIRQGFKNLDHLKIEQEAKIEEHINIH